MLYLNKKGEKFNDENENISKNNMWNFDRRICISDGGMRRGKDKLRRKCDTQIGFSGNGTAKGLKNGMG